MEEVTLPKINVISEDNNTGIFEIEPLAPGFGSTVGNSLRRVLLSSLEGAAITEVKIDGITHEFTSLPHIKEDVLEIILNVKDIKVRTESNEPTIIRLEAKSMGEVRARDIAKNANVEIMNPDQVIATLDKGGQLSMEMVVKKGRGFYPTEEREKSAIFGSVAIDAVFSPTESVNYRVENTRVGQMTNYDKLIIEIKTNGVKTPREAFDQSVAILVEQFKALQGESPSKDKESEVVEIETEPVKAAEDALLDPKTKVTELDLSSRTVNALVNAGVKTVGGLKRMSDLKLSEVKGLGSKGFEEIKKLLNRQ